MINYKKSIYFNPRSPHGERRREDLAMLSVYDDFNPRSPHGERLYGLYKKILHKQFQSTLPARGATFKSRRAHARRKISIHAPRTGSDLRRRGNWPSHSGISIHAPRTGSDNPGRMEEPMNYKFQSTLPARGATWRRATKSTRPRYFNPRSPHGERPGNTSRASRQKEFQSTLPARGATPA